MIVVALTLLLLPAAQTMSLRRPDVVYVPSPQSVVEAMLNMAQVTSRDVVYDLGSGDGRIPITAAQRFGARGVGIEIDPNVLRQAYDNLAKSGVAGRVMFRNEDLFKVDISEATVVTLFLLEGLNLRLLPKLQRELKPGTRIVSHHFDMGDAWPAELTQDVGGLMIYMWTVK
jgi:cyclopropane fatty-acyl-phospholipid synthase-like methyltransferase